MKIRNFVLGFVAALVAVPAIVSGADSKAIDGKWNATVDAGGAPVALVLEFKSEGEKLTGTIAADMGGGQGLPPSPISDGVVKGDDVSFKLSVSMAPDMPALVITYKGKVKGDELSLSSVMDMGQGPQETQVVAKRAK